MTRPYWDQTYVRRTADLHTYAGRLRSNLDRYVKRRQRRDAWREYDGTPMPRIDEEIMVRWLLRKLRRNEPDAFPVGRYEPTFNYEADISGPGAMWGVSIRCLIATTDYERKYFPTIKRLPKHIHTFLYLEVTDARH